MIYVVSTTLVLFGLAVFFLLQWLDARSLAAAKEKLIKKLEGSVDDLLHEKDTLTRRVALVVRELKEYEDKPASFDDMLSILPREIRPDMPQTFAIHERIDPIPQLEFWVSDSLKATDQQFMTQLWFDQGRICYNGRGMIRAWKRNGWLLIPERGEY
jgi:hypothetical protein